jgi:lipoate-protein ligase A
VEAAEALRVPILRRYSGGGTVYHDLGNSLYSFITPRPLFSRSRFGAALASSLHQHGIEGIRVNGRHDLVLEEEAERVRKVGGSAYRIVRERAYHHGTLLLASDLSRLGALLKSPLKIEGAAVSSVVSPVTNVTQLDHEAFTQLAMQAFTTCMLASPPIDVISIDEGDAEGVGEIERDRKELGSWEWVFGRGPAFRVQAGGGEWCSVVDGRIAECTDRHLLGQPFHPRLLNHRNVQP